MGTGEFFRHSKCRSRNTYDRDSSFHLLPMSRTVVAIGQAGVSSFLSIRGPSVFPIVRTRMLYSDLYCTILFFYGQAASVLFGCVKYSLVTKG